MKEDRWEAVIGLEVHIQLATNTKIFCSCLNRFGDPPNRHICPICTGHPGVLPVLNEKALELAVKTAIALNLKIQEESFFARKNYFYPDLPKGYQISQYSHPLAKEGKVIFPVEGKEKEVRIVRLHLEEDAGKLLHGEGEDPYSYVDFNRAGSPLIEIVTEPDFHTPKEASSFLRYLRSVVRTIGASDGDMEKGNLRCDANVSVRRKGDTKLGTKTEIKNINSFRFVEQALTYEIDRQISLKEQGKEIVQETRLFSPQEGKTYPLRTKEEAHDYRYFPEPDLPPLKIPIHLQEKWRKEIPELPYDRLLRFQKEYTLSYREAFLLTEERPLAEFFEEVTRKVKDPPFTATWVINELLRYTSPSLENTKVTPDEFANLLLLLKEGKISNRVGKDLLRRLHEEGGKVKEIAEKEKLYQMGDEEEIQKVVEKVLQQNPSEVERYRKGEVKLLNYFVGQVMKETRGRARADLVTEILKRKLNPPGE